MKSVGHRPTKNIRHLFGILFIATMVSLGAQESSPRPISKAQVDGRAKLAPTHTRVSYGDDPAQFVDVYLAKADKPTPVIIYIHGGGWGHNS